MGSKILSLLHDYAFLALVSIKAIRFWLTPNTGFQMRKRAMILCNGPSLTKDMPTVFERRDGADLYCLNSFCLTEHFNTLKPEFYVLADPMYWRSDVSESILENRTEIISALCQASWRITVICPIAGKPFFARALDQAQKITVVGIQRNECHFKLDGVQMFALKHGLATPNFVNVAILALWWCIRKRIPEIELFGADFSSYLGLRFDENTGETASEIQHFYQDKKKEGMKREDRKYPNRPQKKMHERFFQIWMTFHQIYLLSELSKAEGLNLVNFSNNTNLDTISRVTHTSDT